MHLYVLSTWFDLMYCKEIFVLAAAEGRGGSQGAGGSQEAGGGRGEGRRQGSADMLVSMLRDRHEIASKEGLHGTHETHGVPCQRSLATGPHHYWFTI